MDETKVIRPHHAGHRREYTPEQAMEVLVMEAMRRKGISTQMGGNLIFRFRKMMERSAAEYLITDGTAITLEDCEAGVIQYLRDANTGMVLIPLAELQEKVQSGLSNGRRP